jgi:hypothetical protein
VPCHFRYRRPSDRSNWIRKLPSHGSSKNGFESFRKTFRYFVHISERIMGSFSDFFFSSHSAMQWNYPQDKKDFPDADRWRTVDASALDCKFWWNFSSLFSFSPPSDQDNPQKSSSNVDGAEVRARERFLQLSFLAEMTRKPRCCRRRYWLGLRHRKKKFIVTWKFYVEWKL